MLYVNEGNKNVELSVLNEYVQLTSEEIENDWSAIKENHKTYLEDYGIVLPKEGSAKAYQLIYLYHFMGTAVHKDDISRFVNEHISNAGKDQQVRHLGSQQGWFVLNKNDLTKKGQIIPSGYHLMETIKAPKPTFVAASLKRSVVMNKTDFNEIKKAYNCQCATCGAKEGSIHRYTGTVVVLEQGHMNPTKALGKGNIIPQCQYCNKTAKNNFVFNENGQVEAINNAEFILNSSEDVQKQMFEILKAKYGA